jgi:hypothetical protein
VVCERRWRRRREASGGGRSKFGEIRSQCVFFRGSVGCEAKAQNKIPEKKIEHITRLLTQYTLRPPLDTTLNKVHAL